MVGAKAELRRSPQRREDKSDAVAVNSRTTAFRLTDGRERGRCVLVRQVLRDYAQRLVVPQSGAVVRSRDAGRRALGNGAKTRTIRLKEPNGWHATRCFLGAQEVLLPLGSVKKARKVPRFPDDWHALLEVSYRLKVTARSRLASGISR